MLVRFPLFKEFLQTRPTAEIVISSCDSLLQCGPFGEVRLAIRILDEFFWLRFSVHFFSRRKHNLHEEAEEIIDEEKENEE